jgi:hypothetical protein
MNFIGGSVVLNGVERRTTDCKVAIELNKNVERRFLGSPFIA